jgi:hypothetical protein
MKQPARVPSQLSQSLNRRLSAYALAASAAGVGLLVAQTAEAKIVYTRKHLVLHYGKTFIDLNHDGLDDFYFDLLTSDAGESNQLVVKGFKSENLIWGSFFASALPPGVKIGSSSKKHTGILMAAANSGTCTINKSACGSGPWANVKDRYLGLKFYIKGKVHYGWARLNVSIGGGGREQAPGIDATLTGYAYETIPKKSITTGKTHGKDEEATLGSLAQGASGVAVRRQEQ